MTLQTPIALERLAPPSNSSFGDVSAKKVEKKNVKMWNLFPFDNKIGSTWRRYKSIDRGLFNEPSPDTLQVALGASVARCVRFFPKLKKETRRRRWDDLHRRLPECIPDGAYSTFNLFTDKANLVSIQRRALSRSSSPCSRQLKNVVLRERDDSLTALGGNAL